MLLERPVLGVGLAQLYFEKHCHYFVCALANERLKD